MFPDELKTAVAEGPAMSRQAILEFLKSSKIPSDALIVKSRPKLSFQRKSFKGEFRGSRYRGVSKNGRSYQVFIMIGKRKKYVGPVDGEHNAAKLYDLLAFLHHGAKVRHRFL